MKLPKFKINASRDQGGVIFPDDWHGRDPLLRADYLRDWIFDLKLAYADALQEMDDNWERKRAS